MNRDKTVLITANKINYGSKTTNMKAARHHPELNAVDAERREPVDLPAQQTPDTALEDVS